MGDDDRARRNAPISSPISPEAPSACAVLTSHSLLSRPCPYAAVMPFSVRTWLLVALAIAPSIASPIQEVEKRDLPTVNAH